MFRHLADYIWASCRLYLAVNLQLVGRTGRLFDETATLYKEQRRNLEEKNVIPVTDEF